MTRARFRMVALVLALAIGFGGAFPVLADSASLLRVMQPVKAIHNRSLAIIEQVFEADLLAVAVIGGDAAQAGALAALHDRLLREADTLDVALGRVARDPEGLTHTEATIFQAMIGSTEDLVGWTRQHIASQRDAAAQPGQDAIIRLSVASLALRATVIEANLAGNRLAQDLGVRSAVGTHRTRVLIAIDIAQISAIRRMSALVASGWQDSDPQATLTTFDEAMANARSAFADFEAALAAKSARIDVFRGQPSAERIEALHATVEELSVVTAELVDIIARFRPLYWPEDGRRGPSPEELDSMAPIEEELARARARASELEQRTLDQAAELSGTQKN